MWCDACFVLYDFNLCMIVLRSCVGVLGFRYRSE